MAALGSSRQIISKLNIQEININLNTERPRVVLTNRYRKALKTPC